MEDALLLACRTNPPKAKRWGPDMACSSDFSGSDTAKDSSHPLRERRMPASHEPAGKRCIDLASPPKRHAGAMGGSRGSVISTALEGNSMTHKFTPALAMGSVAAVATLANWSDDYLRHAYADDITVENAPS